MKAQKRRSPPSADQRYLRMRCERTRIAARARHRQTGRPPARSPAHPLARPTPPPTAAAIAARLCSRCRRRQTCGGRKLFAAADAARCGKGCGRGAVGEFGSLLRVTGRVRRQTLLRPCRRRRSALAGTHHVAIVVVVVGVVGVVDVVAVVVVVVVIIEKRDISNRPETRRKCANEMLDDLSAGVVCRIGRVASD